MMRDRKEDERLGEGGGIGRRMRDWENDVGLKEEWGTKRGKEDCETRLQVIPKFFYTYFLFVNWHRTTSACIISIIEREEISIRQEDK